MKGTVIAALLVCAFGNAPAARAAFDIPHCSAPFNKLLSDDVYSRYPARVPEGAITPASPDVRRGKPHLYRTVIREQAAGGPNFAGHYTLIRIGCGAGVVCPAIADVGTGKVFFPPELEQAEALLVDTGDIGVETLNYRRDSRLLIVVGTTNEDPKTTGMSYYLWQSGKLRLLRFIPERRLCDRG